MAELTAAQEDNRVVLQQWLGQFNLSGLGPDVTTWIVQGYSPDRIKLEIQNTPQFNQEFPEYQAAIKAGTPMTPGEIMSYRQTVKSLFTDYGLPSGFYDSNDDFVDLISKRLSPQELQQRVQDGYARVAGAPQAVKDAFNQFFGVQGDNFLATFFLDPERGGKFLTDAVTQAEIGGAGTEYGFGLSQTEAQKYQELGITGQAATAAFKQAYQLQPLSEESISEQEDITASELAEGALTGGEQEKRAMRRRQERSAAFQGGPGGATAGRGGLGLGGST